MKLADFFSPDAIALDLRVTAKEEALEAMVGLLQLDATTSDAILQGLRRREQLGSTGVGGGIAIPHCRSAAVPAVRLAYGRVPPGLAYDAIDGKPVHHLFLIVAPPVEVSNLYLPVLGRLAQFAKDSATVEKLMTITTATEFRQLLGETGEQGRETGDVRREK
jgi:mannitol/fructose-specific phosphotransferase system IIA component (Ntr-type)